MLLYRLRIKEIIHLFQSKIYHLLMAVVVGFISKKQIEWLVPCFVARPHDILALTRSFVTTSVFITSMLTTSSFALKNQVIGGIGG